MAWWVRRHDECDSHEAKGGDRLETTTTQQDATMKAEPEEEHVWLQRLVGDWTYEGESAIGPDQPPQKFEGTESVRSLGSLWTLAEGKGEMPGGGAATTVMTLGYDPQKKSYVGTWIGSMMTHLWVYDGTLDAAGRVLTLETEGPSMAGDGTTAKYRDVIELKSDDHRLLRALVLADDGEWNEFMVASYRRKE